jgi:GNAT superfamily N-acetyltransferase
MIKIRRVRPEEADALTQIAIAAKRYWKYPKHWMELWIPQLTFTPEYFEAHESWAVEQDGNPIAFSTLEERSDNFWVENMWVLPEYIGKGIGKVLFTHAVELARQRGYKTLQLEAEPNAVGFYEKMGLRVIGQHQYELDGQPRILPLMEMIL